MMLLHLTFVICFGLLPTDARHFETAKVSVLYIYFFLQECAFSFILCYFFENPFPLPLKLLTPKLRN